MKEARLEYDVIVPFGKDESKLPPIIMLHGFTSNRHTWESLPRRLANETGRKVFVLDARNHGDSEWTDDTSLQHMANDFTHFMDQHGITTATLIGHSMGGRTAMFLATKEPDRVEKLIVEDSSNRAADDNDRKLMLGYVKLLRKSLEEIPPETDLESAKKILEDFFKAHIPPELNILEGQKNKSIVPPLKKTSDGFAWDFNLDAFEKGFFLDTKPENEINGFYKGPTLVIYGTMSPFKVLDSEDLILKMFPNTTFKGIEEASHSIHSEYPDEFLEVVLEFLK